MFCLFFYSDFVLVFWRIWLLLRVFCFVLFCIYFVTVVFVVLIRGGFFVGVDVGVGARVSF